MLKEALQYLIEIGKPKVLDVDGYKFSTEYLKLVTEPKAKPLVVNTLSALIDYIQCNCDHRYRDGNNFLVHVVAHDRVELVSELYNDAERDVFMVAQAFQPRFAFDQYYGLENFIIAMQACFMKNDDVEKILKVVGNIKDETITQWGDDGVTQSVTAKTGIATVDQVPVPNPVSLAPYRTFIEIEQPESEFVFRMRQGNRGPECALFEADGGAWKLKAIESIKTYLLEHLEATDVLVIG